ncbi:MAG: protein kinase [Elusimicrobia bacterium]|nr:protein kinase [Elusimicrobiota bacterium]
MKRSIPRAGPLLAACLGFAAWAAAAPPAQQPGAGGRKGELSVLLSGSGGDSLPGIRPSAQATQAFVALTNDLAESVRRAEREHERANGAPADRRTRILSNQAVNENLGRLSSEARKEQTAPADREQVSRVLIEIGRGDEALELSQQTLRAEPDNRDALNNSARARFSLGQYQRAIADATRVTEKDPNDERAYTTRAMARYEAGEYQGAFEDAQRAVALNRDNAIAQATLRLAKRKLPSNLNLSPAQAAQAARLLEEDRAYEEQRNQVEAQVAKAAPNPLQGEAARRIASDDPLGAVEQAAKVVEKDPGNAQNWFLLASARNLSGRHEDALAAAGQAIRLSPQHAAAHAAKATAELALGRPQEAAASASEAIRLDPDDAYALALRARAREKLGQRPETLDDLRRAATLSPQYKAEFQRAVDRYASPPAPLRGAPAPEAGESRRPFWLVLVSSLLGGTLIAFGFLHAFSSQWNRRVTTALRRLEEARGGVSPTAPELAALRPHFQIVRVIGKGGMGVVYEAVDKALNRRVALKKMREEIRVDPRERDRFLHEAQTVAALHHPNIVDIHAIVEEGGELCLVFELLSGRTVEQLLQEKGRLSLAEARHALRGACHALEYAHRRGVIHRDLKPSNIMLTDDNEVKVMDFGIARQAKDALSRLSVTNTVAGTPPYMAPEADQGVVRRESDVYALGACLYEMLTGERPFPAPATTSAKLAMSYQKPTRLRRDLPAAVDALIDGALQPDPDRRIASASQFLGQLEAALSVPA